MSDFLRCLPTHGDGRHLSAGAFHRGERGRQKRPRRLDHSTQVALAAKHAGFLGTVIPTGPHYEDGWAVAREDSLPRWPR